MAVAVKLIDTVMTSSPAPIPRLRRARMSASVPELTPMQCRTPKYVAKSSSKPSTLGPRMNWVPSKTPWIAPPTAAENRLKRN